MTLASKFKEAGLRLVSQIAGKYIASATLKMIEQRDIGLVKYGRSLEDGQLTVAELIEHARQEMADGSVYLAAAEDALKKAETAAFVMGSHAVVDVFNIILAQTEGRSADIQLHAVKEWLRGWHSEHPKIRTLYAQPSQFDEWERTNGRLLTLNRINSFPFTMPVVVRHD